MYIRHTSGDRVIYRFALSRSLICIYTPYILRRKIQQFIL